jgi:hypothetical protein
MMTKASVSYWSKTFSPLELTQATQGMATKRVLQNWHARDQWLTPTKTPQPGKAHIYTFAHLLESMIVAEVSRLGLTNELARDFILNRWVTEMPKQSHRRSKRQRVDLAQLPDFERPGQCWVVALGAAGSDETSKQLKTLAVTYGEIGGLLGQLPSFALIDIAGIVDRANRFAETHGTESLEDTPVDRKRRPP